MDTNIIIKNAEKIMHLLSDGGKWKKEDILQHFRLKEEDFYMAIGWLARDNSIDTEDKDNIIIYFLRIQYYF